MNLQPIQQLAMIKRKHLIITLGVIFGGLWLALMAYLLVGSRLSKQTAETTPVVVRTASPTLGSAPSATNTTPRYGMKRLSYQVPTMRLQEPTGTPATGGAAMHIHTTSSTTMKSVGGGGNGIATNSSTNSGSRKGISYGGNMVTISAMLPLAAPGAGRANDIAQVTAGPQARPGVRKVDGPPEIPFPDPVGDIAWSLMVILALAYAGTLYYRRRRAY